MTRGGLPHFSAAEYTLRRAAVDQLAAREGVDALVVFGTAGVQVGELVRIAERGVERLHAYPRGFRRCGQLPSGSPLPPEELP